MRVFVGVLSFFFIGVPASINSWWYLFSNIPPYQWLKEKGWLVNGISPFSILFVIGLIMLFALILSVLFGGRDDTGVGRVAASNVGRDVTVAGRDVHIYTGDKHPEGPIDKADPFCIALDELKQLSLVGHGLVDKFYGDPPTDEEINTYLEDTRTAARRQVLSVPPKDRAKFEKDWDNKDCLRASAELSDSASMFSNPYSQVKFNSLYGRVCRLDELIKTIES